jgi:hypothetical protein
MRMLSVSLTLPCRRRKIGFNGRCCSKCNPSRRRRAHGCEAGVGRGFHSAAAVAVATPPLLPSLARGRPQSAWWAAAERLVDGRPWEGPWSRGGARGGSGWSSAGPRDQCAALGCVAGSSTGPAAPQGASGGCLGAAPDLFRAD